MVLGIGRPPVSAQWYKRWKGGLKRQQMGVVRLYVNEKSTDFESEFGWVERDAIVWKNSTYPILGHEDGWPYSNATISGKVLKSVPQFNSRDAHALIENDGLNQFGAGRTRTIEILILVFAIAAVGMVIINIAITSQANGVLQDQVKNLQGQLNNLTATFHNVFGASP